jgi:hypothetical protein
MSEKPDDQVIAETPAAAPAEAVSLRSSLEAGFAADAAKSAEIKPAAIPDPAQGDAKSAPNRDEAGKFALKSPEAEAEKPVTGETKPTVQPEAAATEAPKEPIPAPAAWTAPAKAKWAAIDPAVQAEIAKRETDMVLGMQKQGDQLKRFERMDEAIAPHRNYLAMNGLDEASYVRSLVAADEQLRGPNPLGALAQIAGMYNIDLRQIGGPAQAVQPGQQPAPQAQPDPMLQQALKEIAELKQSQAQQQSTAQQTEQAQTQAQIDAFAKDHLYFENVRPQMAALLRAGTATMDEAYDMACWARPDIRPLLLKEQADKQAAALRAEASAKASEARQASGSVTGSPAPGASPARVGPSPSIRESLERQFDAAV